MAAEVAEAEARAARRAAAVPPGHLPRVAAHRGLAATTWRRPSATSRSWWWPGETGSGKSTPSSQAVPGAGPGRARPRRPHPAPAPRRPHGGRPGGRRAGHHGGRPGRLHRAVLRPGRRAHADQADDRRHPAGRDAAGPDAAPYDTLIVDEAHERSLNVDFLLGYLTNLLPRRPDLKVIVTSATIDTERFAEHSVRRSVEVSGRTYPVEIRYQPLGPRGRQRPDRRHPPRGGRAAGRGARRHPRVPVGRAGDPRPPPPSARPPWPAPRSCPSTPGCRPPNRPGPSGPTRPAHRAGHQRGRDLDHGAGRALRRRPRHGPHLPLQPAHQGPAPAHRAGQPGLRRPAGRPVRAGGAGRLHPPLRRGRLRRPAAVHRAGDPPHQPGLGHPADGGARARRRRVLPLRGPTRRPRGARRGGAAGRAGRHAGRAGAHAPRPAAGPPADRSPLRPDDPRGRGQRLRPRGADHRRRAVDPGRAGAPRWPGGRGRRAARPLRRPRQRLRRRAQPVALPGGRAAGPVVQRLPADVPGRAPPPRADPRVAGPRTPAPGRGRRARHPAPLGAGAPEAVHRSLLAGLLSHVGMYDPATREHVGARQARFLVAPGSVLHRRPAAWVMAGELVETTRLWARMVARIDPGWIEPLAGHLVRRSYGEPWWDARRGRGPDHREGDAVRAPGRRRPAAGARPGRPGPGPPPVHRARPGGRRLVHPPSLRRRQPGAGGRGAGARGPDPPPRPAGDRRGAGGVLRRPPAPGRDLGPPLRPLVVDGSPPSVPTC